jgi:hypothetical protein
VCQRRGDRRSRVWGAERGGAVPDWVWGAGPGKAAPGLELDAYLQVTTAERFTPYLSAIHSRTRGIRSNPQGHRALKPHYFHPDTSSSPVPFASLPRTPTNGPNRCSLKPLTPETPEEPLLLVLPQRRLTLQVVCRRLPRFQLPKPRKRGAHLSRGHGQAVRFQLGQQLPDSGGIKSRGNAGGGSGTAAPRGRRGSPTRPVSSG